MINRRLHLHMASVVSLGSLLIAAIVVIAYLPALLGAVFVGAGEDADPEAVLAKAVEEHEQYFATYTDRFNGRSVFYPPPRPVAPRDYTPPPVRSVPPPVVREDPVDPPQPVAPARYSGPSISFAVGETIWFKPVRAGEDGFRVSVGEERNGLRVVNVDNLPWSVRIAHGGGEYDVEVIKSSDLFALNRPPSRPLPGLEEERPAGAAAGQRGERPVATPDDLPPPEGAPIAEPAGPPAPPAGPPVPDEEPIDDEGEEPIDEEPFDDEGEEPIDEEPIDDEGEEPIDEEPIDDEGEEPIDEEPIDEGEEPIDEEPIDEGEVPESAQAGTGTGADDTDTVAGTGANTNTGLPGAAADQIRRGAHESEDPAGRPVRALNPVSAAGGIHGPPAP